jgi:hypothetical protein
MPSLRKLFDKLHTRHPSPDMKYYGVTLLGSEDGQIVTGCITSWVGFEDGDLRREIREGRLMDLVEASRHATGWQSIGEGRLVVNRASELLLFLLAGGNALIENSIAEGYKPISDLLRPQVTVRLGLLGFYSANKQPPSVFNKAPTPKHRMRILKRDDYRCRICGRRSTDHVDVELHVHHIRPWSNFGVTADENLITLCHTCHKGIEPHGDWGLFDLIAPGGKAIDVNRGSQEYWKGVARYRDIVYRDWSNIAGNRANATLSNTGIQPSAQKARRG